MKSPTVIKYHTLSNKQPTGCDTQLAQ